ncbi:MAG: LuxR C-terminal-related transcriptional regulator [Chloroflexaceae bacterium]|jgi:LuxR family maltose regulon positive regulatory protein|nr:LuxR C-terminal-related transcriptional regulator [Chloroflexaceae bacterium]
MPLALLATKLYRPQPRPNAVARPHLLARLNAGLHHRLTLIAAPPGFGKTTLASAWLATSGRPAAWLTLEYADNEPTRFLAYLVAALQTLGPTPGTEVAALLQSPQPPPIEALLPLLLNDLTTLPQPALLVLDDYHVLDNSTIHQALAFLLEHLPPQLHLVITSREEPPLPLPRLRARSQLTELRAADLRFTPAEAAQFLQEVMGLNLAPADIAALEAHTEGWIAGLQLAALSMQNCQDIPGFIQAFAGNHRYILDYLIEEVLQRQPEGVRSFLLQTAILERLSGPLCDAVTGQPNGKARLEALERGNFFLVPLDDTRHWYRYHQLFGEALLAQLQAEQPELITTLHQRASRWYEQHNSPSNAIRHALAAQEVARAADMVELTLPAMRRNRQEATLLGWLKALPEELLRTRPVLSVGAVGALLAVGDLNGVEGYLASAEGWLDISTGGSESRATAAEMVVVDEAAFRQLPGAISVYRAALALALGDVGATVSHARRALDHIPADDQLLRGAAAGLLGMAFWADGNLEAAQQAFSNGLASLQQAQHLSDVIGLAIALADIRMVQGRLREARRNYERGVQLATAQHPPLLRGTVDVYVGLSELAREQNDLQTAMQHLLRAEELGEHMGLPQSAYRWRVAMARLKQTHGDLDGALSLLDEAERRYVGDFFPNVRSIAALRTRLWLAQGRLAEALSWARAQGLSADDNLSYRREFEYITLARVLLARARVDRSGPALRESMALLQRLLHAAEAGERTGRLIEILLLQALAQQQQGHSAAALAPLARAISLAEPEGYVRTFVDEGQPMVALLQAAANGGIAPSYVRQLLAASGEAENVWPLNQGLVEPLSEREQTVLRLLRSELSGPEIARELMVSLNTLRTHTRHIYDKLGVNSRRAAVRRAEDLRLL